MMPCRSESTRKPGQTEMPVRKAMVRNRIETTSAGCGGVGGVRWGAVEGRPIADWCSASVQGFGSSSKSKHRML